MSQITGNWCRLGSPPAERLRATEPQPGEFRLITIALQQLLPWDNARLFIELNNYHITDYIYIYLSNRWTTLRLRLLCVQIRFAQKRAVWTQTKIKQCIIFIFGSTEGPDYPWTFRCEHDLTSSFVLTAVNRVIAPGRQTSRACAERLEWTKADLSVYMDGHYRSSDWKWD